jgi:uncharacterized membrane protein (UPF0127 family)
VDDRTEAAVAERVGLATAFWPRLKGLLGRRKLDADEGIYFPNCSSIHMLGMLFAIDVLYVDSEMKVLRVVENLRPWRLSMCVGARGVVELSSGVARARDVRVGDPLRLDGPVD